MPEIAERCPVCQVATSDMSAHLEKYHPILATASAPAEITERDRDREMCREARIVHEFARTHAMDLSGALDLVQHLIPEFAQARTEGYAAGKASRDAEVHKMAVGVAKLDVEVQRLTQRIAELEAALRAIHEGACRTAQDSRSRDEDRYCIARVIETSNAALAQKGGE